jgi:hypothetical protein
MQQRHGRDDRRNHSEYLLMAEPLTTDDLITMERAARKFQGAFTGTSGTLAGYVILLLGEVRRLRVEAAMKENAPPISYD